MKKIKSTKTILEKQNKKIIEKEKKKPCGEHCSNPQCFKEKNTKLNFQPAPY